MYAKLIILASAFACAAATGNAWAWKNVAEPQCNNCKCYGQTPQIELIPLWSLFAKKRLMGSKLRLQ